MAFMYAIVSHSPLGRVRTLINFVYFFRCIILICRDSHNIIINIIIS